MQVKVPKFIDIEDKILSLGGFGITWKQVVALCLGIGLGAIAYVILVPIFGFPLLLVGIVLGFLLAFGRWNERPFSAFLSAIWNYFWSPRAYVWHKEPHRVKIESKHPGSVKPGTGATVRHDTEEVAQAAATTASPAEETDRLRNIARLLDQ